MIVKAAMQQDVQFIGSSILSGAHNAIVPRVVGLLHKKNLAGVEVIVGGIIPDEDAAMLKKSGGWRPCSSRALRLRESWNLFESAVA